MRASLILTVTLFAFACKNDPKDPADDTDTTADDTDTTADDTDTTDDTDVVVTPTCESYCTAVTSACSTDPSYGFPTEGACVSWCTGAGLQAGDEGDTSGNTIGCRIYHASVAEAGDAAAKTEHCPHASGFGGGVCGGQIENFCDIITHACTGANAPTWAADCATDAATWTMGTPGATSGDSLSCRIYHLGVAVLLPDDHCLHADADGGGVCVDI